MIADSLGCGNESFTNIEKLECLQAVQVDDLLKSVDRTGPVGSQAVIDSFLPPQDQFLPQSAKMMMVMGMYNQDVDILLGCNKDEGLIFTTPIYANHSIIDEWRKEWMTSRGPMYMLGLEPEDIDNDATIRLNAINEFYLESLDYMTFENITQVTNMHSDSWFCYASYDLITRHIANVKQNNTYQYLYTHQGEHSLGDSRLGGELGVEHGDELYLQFFPFAAEDIKLNEEDEEMSEILMSLWKNFIKHGKPSTADISWEPIVDGNDRKYLHLNGSAAMQDSSEVKERMVFWDQVMNLDF